VGDRPLLDFARLIGRTQEVVFTIHEKKQLHDHLVNSGVAVYEGLGPARFVDPHTIELGDSAQRLTAKSFIICAGGYARRLPFPGAEHTLTHGDIWNLRELPRRLAVIGAAATGCQLASIMNTFGARVTLLDVAPHILPAEDEAVTEALQKAFTGRGIDIVCGMSGIERVEKDQDGLRLVYTRDGAEATLSVDAVVVAVGWPGNVDALNAPAAGVKTERSYIISDEYLRTTTPHIFAAGDIDGRLMLVQSAGSEARVAAENAVAGLGTGVPRAYRPFIVPHGGFTDPEYGSVGMTERRAREEGRDYVVALASMANLDRAVIDGYTEGFCKLIVARDSREILGAHVVGEQAVEIVHLVAAPMAAGLSVETLADLELSYPTYISIVGLAARRAVFHLGLMELAPEWCEMGPYYAAEWERRAA
jgi:dihydrolipoamide dehydrogenase